MTKNPWKSSSSKSPITLSREGACPWAGAAQQAIAMTREARASGNLLIEHPFQLKTRCSMRGLPPRPRQVKTCARGSQRVPSGEGWMTESTRGADRRMAQRETTGTSSGVRPTSRRSARGACRIRRRAHHCGGADHLEMPEPPARERGLRSLAERFSEAEARIRGLVADSIDGDRRELAVDAATIMAALRRLDARGPVRDAYVAAFMEVGKAAPSSGLVPTLAASLASKLDRGAQTASANAREAIGVSPPTPSTRR